MEPAQAVAVLDRFIANARNPDCGTNDYVTVAAALGVLRATHPPDDPEAEDAPAPNRQARRAAGKNGTRTPLAAKAT